MEQHEIGWNSCTLEAFFALGIRMIEVWFHCLRSFLIKRNIIHKFIHNDVFIHRRTTIFQLYCNNCISFVIPLNQVMKKLGATISVLKLCAFRVLQEEQSFSFKDILWGFLILFKSLLTIHPFKCVSWRDSSSALALLALAEIWLK